MSGQTTPSLAPLPQISFRVGITGHRPNRLDDGILAELAAQLTRILKEIRDVTSATPPLHRSQLPPRLRLNSSLAEGTDSIAVQAAQKLHYELQVSLPFSEREYEQTFIDASSVAPFRQVLEKSVPTFRVNARFSTPELGFRSAGEIMLNQSDLLIAVWDGQDPHGVGGTAEVVARALDLGIPVMHINSQEPARLRWMDANGIHPHGIDHLREYIKGVLSFAPDAKRSSKDGVLKRVLRSIIPQLKRLSTSQQYVRTAWPKRTARSAYTFARLVAEHRLKLPDTLQQTKEVSAIEAPSLKRYFLWADALAIHYGELSRSASLWIQIFTATSIFSSLFIVIVELSKAPWLENCKVNIALLPHALSLSALIVGALSVAELLSILGVLGAVTMAGEYRWHARWLCYRAVAEQIRSLDLLHPLGLAIPRPHGFSAEDDPSDEEVFSAFLIQSIVRELDLASSSIDESFVRNRFERLSEVIHNQAAFHEATGKRHEEVEAVLTVGSLTVFVLACVICALDVFSSFGKSFLSPLFVRVLESVWLATIAVLLPTLGATLAALATQGEFRRLAGRSVGMHRTLERIGSQLKHKDCTNLRELSLATAEVAEVFLSEVRQWQALVSARAPSIS